MSAVEALEPRGHGSASTSTAEEIASRPARARLRVLAPVPGARLSRVPFVLSLLLLLAAGMGGLVVVNTQIQTQATELSALQQEATHLRNQKAQLQAEVNKKRSSASLEQEAYRMGLRPNPKPAFIVLPSGKILGTPTKVTGKELPDQVYLTWQQHQAGQKDSRTKAAQEKAAKKRAEEAAAAAEAQRIKDAEAKQKKADEAAQTAADKKAADKKASDKKKQPSPSAVPSADQKKPSAGGQ